jgi:hypothetical protein
MKHKLTFSDLNLPGAVSKPSELKSMLAPQSFDDPMQFEPIDMTMQFKDEDSPTRASSYGITRLDPGTASGAFQDETKFEPELSPVNL